MGLGIGDLTHGVSVSGSYQYLDDINRIAIRETQDNLRNTKEVKAALQAGWQGAAEANFERNMDTAVTAVCGALETLKTNLDSLFAELVENMADQDNLLVPEADDIVKFN